MKPAKHYSLPLCLITLLVSPVVQAATADDVECIRCVDTTDINYNAVTSNRILDGTIRNVDLGLDAVTSSRIKAGEVRTSDLAPNAVTTSRIMNGAVTEAKLHQDLQDRINQLEAKLAALEAILDYFSLEQLYDGSTGNYYPTVRVTGANLQVVNGTNDTGTVNGTGNLIVGYNKNYGLSRCSDGQYADETTCTAGGAIWSNQHRSGSHNIISGEGNNYSRYGGLIAGTNNTINGAYASVSGGDINIASGDYSSVSGGSYNTASGEHSRISGGGFNTASGYTSSVSGGSDNSASGDFSSVSGGVNNIASGHSSSVSGGENRSATGAVDWAAGSLFEDN